MQTFLPYGDFQAAARSLDYKRLGKQRVEAWQIYQAITNPQYGWQNHPAVLQWKGYEYHLAVYGAVICGEWTSRGYKDTLRNRFVEAVYKAQLTSTPWWLGNKQYHDSHRRMLLHKDYEWYSKAFGEEDTAYLMQFPAEYWWPSKHVLKGDLNATSNA